MNITIEQHNGIYVLRDDLLPGGTKSTFLGQLLEPGRACYVYASPVYGAMQIALAQYCQTIGAKAVIFCAKRGKPHPNSLRAKEAGAIVYQVPHGYLSHCQAKAKLFAEENNGQYIAWGANYQTAIDAIAKRTKEVILQLGFEPDEIYCAVGSGTLLKGIYKGTNNAELTGVMVGADFNEDLSSRVRVIKHPKKFEDECKITAPFPSSKNYDLKAWEICMQKADKNKKVLFWNVF